MQDRGISTAIVKVVARALAELGAPPRMFEGDDASYVPGPEADALVNDAASVLGDPSIGLSVARRLQPGSLGPLDYAMLTAKTFGEALRRSAQFYAVVSDRVVMSIEEHGDEACVIQRRLPGQVQNRHWVEMTFAVVTERARQGVGAAFALRSVAFLHHAPGDTTAHEQFFAAPVAFDQPVDRLAFDRSLLDAQLLTSAAALAAAIERQLAELVSTTHDHQLDPTLIRVRAALAQRLDEGSATLEVVAHQLGMSPRTLQRTLHEHGTAFKPLLDDMRRDRALALLQDGKLTVAEVASKVGFAEATGFFRAFRRWTGTTPGSRRVTDEDDHEP